MYLYLYWYKVIECIESIVYNWKSKVYYIDKIILFNILYEKRRKYL